MGVTTSTVSVSRDSSILCLEMFSRISTRVLNTAFLLGKASPKALNPSSTVIGQNVRWGHTDLKVPSFDDYRRSNASNPKENNSNIGQRVVSYTILSGGAAVGVYAAKSVVTGFVMFMAPSAGVTSFAKVEVDISGIPEGKNVVIKWRSKPLFVRHRTAAEIESVKDTDMSMLRDPQHDHERTVRPEWLVCMGVCTHLGCVPISHAGDYGGYFCPCHGSHYDASGRVRKGPAPTNLEVPSYEFQDELLVVN